MEISIVSPVYNAKEIVSRLVELIILNASVVTNEYEIILVDDGSTDESWSIIKDICQNISRVKGIKLSRNFGQHYAISAGINNVTGNWVVVMDCDLQDRPDEIPKLYNKAKEGYDIVWAQRRLRKDTKIKIWFSSIFYKTFAILTNTRQDATIANFGIYNKKVIESVTSMNDEVKFFPSMVQWVGFKSTKVEVNHSTRLSGKSNYSIYKLIKLAWNIIVAFSNTPLKISIYLGTSIALCSFIVGIIFMVKYFNGDIVVQGYSSLIISIWFLSGLIILNIGIVGIYIGKIFDTVKQRPHFVIEEKVNY